MNWMQDLLAASGIKQPSPIQAAAMPKILDGRSCALRSCAGSGKVRPWCVRHSALTNNSCPPWGIRHGLPSNSSQTLAYLLPALTRALHERHQQQASGASREQQHAVQVLVVAPSQELAMQILRVAQGVLPAAQRHLAQHAIGGANPKRQHEALRRHRPLLVVGTPGRILELIESGGLRPRQCPLLVLDEVRASNRMKWPKIPQHHDCTLTAFCCGRLTS